MGKMEKMEKKMEEKKKRQKLQQHLLGRARRVYGILE